jgi:hypothetical protein
MRNVCFIAVIVGLLACSTVGSTAAPQQESSQSQTLVDVVREATAQFLDPEVAVAAGYVPKPVCVSGPNEGAMGVHFVNPSLLSDGKLDPQHPETLVYESKNGRVRLVAAEFVVFKADWEAQGNKLTPGVLGQLLNFIPAPNRFGFPDFYELHVWAWKDNPFGMFVDWNPRVSCAEHAPNP